MTATHAFCVRMLTRTYCWQRRRYLLERTCLHLLAPPDSHLLLAASVKVKILFPFFFLNLRKEWALLSSSLGAWHLCAQPQHEFGENMVTQGKSGIEGCLSSTAVSQTQCRQYKYLFLMEKTICEMRSRNHQSVHYWCKIHLLRFSPP